MSPPLPQLKHFHLLPVILKAPVPCEPLPLPQMGQIYIFVPARELFNVAHSVNSLSLALIFSLA